MFKGWFITLSSVLLLVTCCVLKKSSCEKKVVYDFPKMEKPKVWVMIKHLLKKVCHQRKFIKTSPAYKEVLLLNKLLQM